MQIKRSSTKQNEESAFLSICYVVIPILIIIIMFFTLYGNTSRGKKAALIGISGGALWFFWDFVKSLKVKNRDQAIVSLVRAIILTCVILFAFLNEVFNLFSL